MESPWVGSDVDLSTLHKCRLNDRLEYRMACLPRTKEFITSNKNNVIFKNYQNGETVSDDDQSTESSFRRRRRSGTWP